MAHPVHASDRNRLLAGFILAVVGMDVFIVQPGIVQVLVERAGLTESEAGYVASAEMFGIAFATVAMAYSSRRCQWRRLAWVALAVNAIANAAAMLAVEIPLLMLTRGVAGISSGVLVSLGYALVGSSANPDRNYGILIALVLVYGAAGLFFMPGAVASHGLPALFTALGLFALLAMLVVRHVPSEPPEGAAATTFGVGGCAGFWLLASVFGFFLGQGLVWPYLALIGVSGNASPAAVGTGLMVSQLLGIVGAALAASIGAPQRHGRLLFAGIAVTVASALVFARHPDALTFGAAVSVFNLAANMVTPLLMAILAATRSSQLIVTGAAVQMLGLAIGPAVAATLVAPGEYTSTVALAVSLFLFSLLAGRRGRRVMDVPR